MKLAITILVLLLLAPIGDTFNRWARTGGRYGRTYTKRRSGTAGRISHRDLEKRLEREERELMKKHSQQQDEQKRGCNAITHPKRHNTTPQRQNEPQRAKNEQQWQCK